MDSWRHSDTLFGTWMSAPLSPACVWALLMLYMQHCRFGLAAAKSL